MVWWNPEEGGGMRCAARDRSVEEVITQLEFGNTGLSNALYKLQQMFQSLLDVLNPTSFICAFPKPFFIEK